MLNPTYWWIFLVAARQRSELFGLPSILFTLIITAIQFAQVILLAQKKNYRFIHFFLMSFFMLICVYNKSTLATLNILLSIILLRNESIKKIIFVCFISTVFISFVVFGEIFLGMMPDKIVKMPKGIAHTFGFENSNIASSFFFNLIILTALFLLFFTRLRWSLLLLIIPSYVIYKLTLGRTYFYSEMLFFFFIVIMKLEFFKTNFFRWLYKIAPIVLMILLIIGLKVFEKFPILDILFTTRFSKNSAYFNDCGPINYLIGYKLRSDGPMDCAYLAQFFSGGILSVYLFIKYYTIGIQKMEKNNIPYIIPLILVIIIAGIAENSFSTFSCITICFYGFLLKSDNLIIKE